AHALLQVADARETVFVPPIGSRASMIVGQVLPGTAIAAVVLAHRAPGTLTHVRAEQLPFARVVRRRRAQACMLSGQAVGVVLAFRHGGRNCGTAAVSRTRYWYFVPNRCVAQSNGKTKNASPAVPRTREAYHTRRSRVKAATAPSAMAT